MPAKAGNGNPVLVPAQAGTQSPRHSCVPFPLFPWNLCQRRLVTGIQSLSLRRQGPNPLVIPTKAGSPSRHPSGGWDPVPFPSSQRKLGSRNIYIKFIQIFLDSSFRWNDGRECWDDERETGSQPKPFPVRLVPAQTGNRGWDGERGYGNDEGRCYFRNPLSFCIFSNA